jgi:phage baseplate assembly protein W
MTITATIPKVYSDIDLSFQPHPNTGDIGKKLDINAVKQSLRNILLTRYFERPFQPHFGSPIYQLLFEPLDPITAAAIKQAVERAIQNYEPRVQILRLDVFPDFDANAYSLVLYFNIIGLRDIVTFSTLLQRLR